MYGSTLSSGKVRVGVIRGGPSSEYEVSLKTGGSVLRNLPEKYRPQDIFISRQGEWHMDGVPRSLERILGQLDVVFNALHGEYGEDGKVQKLLDGHGMLYTGSGALASALGMNKLMSKKVFLAHGLRTPSYVALRRGEETQANIREIFSRFVMPAVVKPATTGSSVGVSIVWDVVSLEKGIADALALSEVVLVEEFISGREATCGVIDGFRDQKHYSLLPIEIVHSSKFFDYEAKYGGATQEICPGNFSKAESEELQNLAVAAHRALGLRHYSRSDFIVSPNRGIFILESNSLPGLTEQSLLPKSIHAVGSTLPEFLDHLIALARK